VRRVVLFMAVLALAQAGSVRADAPAVIPTGVTIGGVAVGGLAPDAATTAVQQAFQTPLEFDLGTSRIFVTPDLLGAKPSIDAAIAQAAAAAPDTQLPLQVSVDQTVTAGFVAKLGKRFDRAAVNAQLLLRRNRPFITRDRAGRKLDQRRTVRDAAAALTANKRDPIRLATRAIKPKVTRAKFGPVIVIHRGLNRLYLYRGMRFWRVFSVATGQTLYPTPLGRFRIVVKWRNPWWYPPASPWAKGSKPIPPGPGNPLGTRWMGLSAPGVGIHGTPSDGSIGYSVSHGCIRMHIPEAEWLFNHVEIGTTVFIVPS